MRLLFSAILSFLFLSGIAQMNAGPDQIICVGETTSLQGSGPANYTYEWTSVPNDPTISDPTSLTPSVTPSTTTVYTLEGRSVGFQNLVVNGHFESGNMGFTSSYLYSPGPNGLWNEGTYAITDDASYNHNNFSCNQDHTSGSGNFMAVNGSGAAGVVVWSTSINITPNTEYEFSTWVMSLSPNSPAILQFRINNVLMGEPFQATSTTCQWHMFFEQWNSGSATTAEISIINQNTATDGNDFSLDDINFSKVTYFYDECTVTVNSIPTSDFDMDSESCSADTVVISYLGTPSSTATYNWEFGNATIISGTGAGPYELQWPDEGIKTVSLSVDDACLSDTTTKLIDILQSPAVNVGADATSIPYGTSTTLHGSITGNSGELTYEWDPEDSLVNPNHLHPQTILLKYSTFYTFTSVNETNLCSAFDTITIHVTGGPLALLSISATPDTICDGSNTDLDIVIEGGSGSYTSTWRSEPPGFTHIGPETSITVAPTESTTYYVTSDDGFNITPEDSIHVVVQPQIEIINQPVDTLISVGQTAIFKVEASNELSYQWQVSDNSGSTWDDIMDDNTYTGSQTNELTVTNTSSGMSFLLYRCLIEGPCDPVFSSIAELIVIDSPMFIGILEDVTACENDTIYVPCQISNFIEIDSFSLDFAYDTSMMTYVDLINNNAELSSMLIDHNFDSLNLQWSSSTGTTLTDGIFFEFMFIAKSGGEDSLIWDPSSTVRNSYNFYPILNVSSSNIIITALPVAPDLATASPDSLNILDEIDIDLEASGGSGYELVWTMDSCMGDTVGIGENISIFRPEQTTTYYSHWYNQCGISECEQVTVKIIEQYSFAVPNAFTPNGDNLNDEFGILSPSTLPVFDFFIFNRWGQLVFSTKDQTESWDGTYNGEPSPLGVYIWKAKYQYRIEGTGSELHEESGTVTLIR